ncbi:hypothetical protein JAAARDRAFT_31427 [Jaapia argillacea MUCL 33604]|uniref:Fungal lipase-type domain-containing protein n=1 Tax=Jaapia argillacea MUCL 33604 TaxID=933084 RepID=A0A067QEM9_9AGAM|nr:hypothetical protein JAAARDRAFT_31427 [Jaapia argillacea MUCL 33604]
MVITLLLLALLAFHSVLAAPLPLSGLVLPNSNLATPVTLSVASIQANLVRPAMFSQIAYCPSAKVLKWQCGASKCAAVSGVQVLQAGGDGGLVPYYYVAYDPTTQSIVVAHEGTNPLNILSIANDLEFGLVNLNSTLFPHAGSGVQVHEGFQQTFGRTSDTILAAVKNGLHSKGARNVVVTGHSLGAAIATMDAVMLRQQLDPSISVTSVVFGLPRGGNVGWANFVDSTLGTSFTHVTNQNDPVPTVPPELFGYVHPSQEVHIVSANAVGATTTVACPGRENPHCSDGDSLLNINVANHLGPYFQDIVLSTTSCPL